MDEQEKNETMRCHRDIGQIVVRYGPNAALPALLMVIAEIIVSYMEKQHYNKSIKLLSEDIKNNIKRVEERLAAMGRIQ
jgi:hypothetical protein